MPIVLLMFVMMPAVDHEPLGYRDVGKVPKGKDKSWYWKAPVT